LSEPDYVARNRELWTTKNAEYTDPDAVGAWSDPAFKWGVFGVMRSAGFAIERLIELQIPDGATRHEYYSDHDPEWARNWPMEEIWVARKTG
jgi:hypothetical protein